MTTTIKLKRSATTGKTPQLADLLDGELALNTADGKLFYRTAAGAVGAISASDEKTVALANGTAIDLTAGRYFVATPSGAKTYTLSGVPAAPAATCFLMDITNGAGATITWFPNVKWARGTAPTLTAGRDLLGFVTHDGVNWVGLLLGDEIA